ncbi:hypothetical protein Tco_0401516 [Tanacetum coccineum]
MVGTRGALLNASTSGNGNTGNHDSNAGMDDQTNEIIRKLIETSITGLKTTLQTVLLQQEYLTRDFNSLKIGKDLVVVLTVFSVEHVDDQDKVKLASIHFYDGALVWHQQFEKLNGDLITLGWHLKEIHVTWAHLEKKETRLRLYTIYLEELCIQRVETASQTSSDDVRIFKMTASREVPSFDEPKPQPQPLRNCPSLDVSLGDERGPKPPIKPLSLDSFRTKVVDLLTIHIPPSPHLASFHPKDMYCYYHPCIDDSKKHYGFKPGLLGHSGSLGANFSKLEVIEDDWELESKEVSFLGRGLNSPVRPKEVQKACSFMLCMIVLWPLSLSLSPLPSVRFVFLQHSHICMYLEASKVQSFAEVVVFNLSFS